MLVHRVMEEENRLGLGQSFLGVDQDSLTNIDLNAAEKELYLGRKCQVDDHAQKR